MGLRPAIHAHGVYVLPVLLFVAQLESPPRAVYEFGRKAVRAIAPGLGAWCQPQDFHLGDAFGLAQRLRPLKETCHAVMLRARAWEVCRGGGIPWERLQSELRVPFSSAEFLSSGGQVARVVPGARSDSRARSSF